MITQQSTGLRQKFRNGNIALIDSSLNNAATEQSQLSTSVFFFLFFSEPKISLPILNHRVDGRKLVKISRIESTMINGDIEGDWVTIAVLVRKVTQKKSSSGKNFSGELDGLPFFHKHEVQTKSLNFR